MAKKKTTGRVTVTAQDIILSAQQVEPIRIRNLIGDGQTHTLLAKKLTVQRLQQFEDSARSVQVEKDRCNLPTDHPDYITTDELADIVGDTTPAFSLILEHYVNDDGEPMFTRKELDGFPASACIKMIEGLISTVDRSAPGKASGIRGRRT